MRKGSIGIGEIAAAAAITVLILGLFLKSADVPPALPQEGEKSEGVASSQSAASDERVSQSLDELRTACVAEARANVLPALGQMSSCERYAQAIPRRTPSPQRPTVAANPAPVQVVSDAARTVPDVRSISILVNECLAYGKGTIAYRNCRAREAKRLADACTGQRAKLELAAFDEQSDTRALLRAYCHAADAYRVLD